MKKLFLFVAIAFCLVAVGCKKTCNCTETATTTFDSSWMGEDLPSMFGELGTVTSTYTAEAKKCSDLDAHSTVTTGFSHVTTVVTCK